MCVFKLSTWEKSHICDICLTISDAVTRSSSIMSGRSTTLISYEPPAMNTAGSDNTDGDDGQLAKLQEKVKICLGAILVRYF